MSWVFLTDVHAYKLKKPVHYEGLDFRTVSARRFLLQGGAAAQPPACTGGLSRRGPARRVRRWPLACDRSRHCGRLAGEDAPATRGRHAGRAAGTRCRYTGADAGRGGWLRSTMSNLWPLWTPAVTGRCWYGTSRGTSATCASRQGRCLGCGWRRSARSSERCSPPSLPAWTRGSSWVASSKAMATCGRNTSTWANRPPSSTAWSFRPSCVGWMRPTRWASLRWSASARAAALGRVLLQSWREASGDAVPDALLHFYQSCRACSRARLAIRHLRESRYRGSPVWRRRAMGYLALAERHLRAW